MKILFLSAIEIKNADALATFAKENESTIEFFYNENEGEIIDKIHSAYHRFNFIIMDTAAFKESFAIADAIKSVDIPLIEVSNGKSVLSTISMATFHGSDDSIYLLALKGAIAS